MKKAGILVVGIVLLIVTVLSLYRLNKDFLLLWNVNNVKVTASEPLTTQKAKIEFGISVNTISRETDEDLFKNREKYTVLYDGAAGSEMINDYGENDFLITYNDQYYFSFRQFKFNRRHQHNYYFNFVPDDSSIILQVQIDGKDAMKFERPMLLISQADQYVCNVPLGTEGDVYNMIELVP